MKIYASTRLCSFFLPAVLGSHFIVIFRWSSYHLHQPGISRCMNASVVINCVLLLLCLHGEESIWLSSITRLSHHRVYKHFLFAIIIIVFASLLLYLEKPIAKYALRLHGWWLVQACATPRKLPHWCRDKIWISGCGKSYFIFSRNEWTTSRQPWWHHHLSSCRVVKMSFPQLQQTLVQNVDMLVGRCRPASCVMKRTKSERPVLMCQQVKVILRFANYYSRVTRWQLAKLSKEIQFFYTKY